MNKCLIFSYTEWQDWGKCSKTCRIPGYDIPIVQRSRKVVKPSFNNGISCDQFQRTENLACCDLPLCPQKSDCQVGQWSDWSTCPWPNYQATTKKRTRSIIKDAENNGKECCNFDKKKANLSCPCWVIFHRSSTFQTIKFSIVLRVIQ